MKRYHIWLFLLFLLPTGTKAQDGRVLTLPRLEQLSDERVTQVIQDAEGYLWYATEGGGVCRDDGRQMTAFRSDAEHPDLLGSNDVASIAAAGSYIIIGTYHGAYLLDKQDYSIRRLAEVDDKRVDDIIISRNGHWWLTSNKKIYEYAEGQLLKTYSLGDKYIFRLREDSTGTILATEWEGGQLRLERERFVQVTTEWPDSIDFTRVMTDRQGRQLVADGLGKCYALEVLKNGRIEKFKPFFEGDLLSKTAADSIRAVYGLSARPTALCLPPTPPQGKGAVVNSPLPWGGDGGGLFFSTGKDIRCMRQGREEVVLPETKDVSAMTFANDGTLWLATVFGTLMTYRDGTLATDDYASNEYGDAIVALQTDSLGRIVIVTDRYVRLYDPVRHTLRQQNIESDGIYALELQETSPGERWSQPEQPVNERMPQWAWWLLAIFVVLLSVLIAYVWFLHRQRKRFLEMMKSPERPRPTPERPTPDPSLFREGSNETAPSPLPKQGGDGGESWLPQAISVVEAHIADEHYNVEQLSSDLCMSRMTLYRKIQSVTGQKPTEFIRTIRLRRAAELLREGRMNITEISYATGFSSVSYFSRCFRTMFGVPPTQFS